MMHPFPSMPHFIIWNLIDVIVLFQNKGAASKGNSKIVDLLLSGFKANPNQTDVTGNSPL